MMKKRRKGIALLLSFMMVFSLLMGNPGKVFAADGTFTINITDTSECTGNNVYYRFDSSENWQQVTKGQAIGISEKNTINILVEKADGVTAEFTSSDITETLDEGFLGNHNSGDNGKSIGLEGGKSYTLNVNYIKATNNNNNNNNNKNEVTYGNGSKLNICIADEGRGTVQFKVNNGILYNANAQDAVYPSELKSDDKITIYAKAKDGEELSYFQITVDGQQQIEEQDSNTAKDALQSNEGYSYTVKADSLTNPVIVNIEFRNQNGSSQPILNEGDICFIKGDDPNGGKIKYSTNQTNWTEVGHNGVVNSGTISNGATIYVKYELNGGYKLDDWTDENGNTRNNIDDGTNTTSLKFNENQIASFVYDAQKNIRWRFVLSKMEAILSQI